MGLLSAHRLSRSNPNFGLSGDEQDRCGMDAHSRIQGNGIPKFRFRNCESLRPSFPFVSVIETLHIPLLLIPALVDHITEGSHRL